MVLSTVISLCATDLSPYSAQPQGVKGTSTPLQDREPKDLGVYGQVFPIDEHSLLEAIRGKLQALAETGALERHQRAILGQAIKKLKKPAPVPGISKTTQPRSFAYDPSVTVPYDLKDHKGEVFHRKGTRINPLDTHAFRCPFLFVDGEDETQVAWAIRQHQAAPAKAKPKIILVQGAPFDMSQKLNLPVYFDQAGVLVRKFGITQVPARVSQQNRKLVIEEVNPCRQKVVKGGGTSNRHSKGDNHAAPDRNQRLF